jgi:predicted nucleic acid-binding protein
MARYLVDTNVLLRVAEPHSVQHLAAVEAVAKLISQKHELCLAPQGLAEFWVAATRPADVNGLGWSFEAVELEVARLLELVVQHRVVGKQGHDARLAAIMNINGLAHILTFNANNFRAYDLTVVSPDEVVGS